LKPGIGVVAFLEPIIWDPWVYMVHVVKPDVAAKRPAAIGAEITLLGGRRGEFACGTIAVDDLVVGGARHATADLPWD
jgi:hypothetical protein